MATKPPRKSGPTKKPAAKPADSLMGWLGRQVGHVKNAVKTDVTKPPAKSKSPSTTKGARPQATAGEPSAKNVVVYRDDKIEEVDHPTKPGLKLRRTIIDEVIVNPESSQK